MEETSKEKENNNIIINEQSSITDKTFNRLKELQSLLKKESALKELCKKTKLKIKIKLLYII